MKQKLLNNNSLNIPKSLIHLFGLDNAIYLVIASEYAQEAKNEIFKMPIKSVEKKYGITRFKQLASCEYFESNDILIVGEGECLNDGRNYSFNQEALNVINNIVAVVGEKELEKFKFKANKNIIKKKLDLSKLCALVEKL